MNKNIFDKFQDLLVKQVENFNKREDKDVLKKIPFWMVFFFPYGLYLFIFKTNIKKRFKAIFITLLSFVMIIAIDVSLYPNRVYDNVGKESYIEFISNNPELKLEEPLYVSKSNHFSLNNQMYFMFNIYDKLNMYNGIFKVNDYNKNYELVSLYDIDYNFSNVYSNDTFKGVKDIHPAILSIVLPNSKEIEVKDISKVTDVFENDIFKNILSQDIKIKNKTYSFSFSDFDVVSIKDSNGKSLYSIDFSSSLKQHLPQVATGLLQRNFGSNYKLVGYNYLNSKHYFNVDVAGTEYSVEYFPGHNATLLTVSNKEEFVNYMENLMRK